MAPIMLQGTETQLATATAAAAAMMTGTPASDITQPSTVSATAVSRTLTPPAVAVPEGVTVVYAERKRTGRIAGAKYKADGTPYKRSGPPPKPLHERTAYKQRVPVKRIERSYTEQRKKEVIAFLECHKLACDDIDAPARRNRGRAEQQPPAEKGYRWPTLSEASEWFKVPEGTIHGWWQRRDKIMGRVPKKPTRVEQRRLAEEEERKRREDEDRRTLLEAIGWPAERLPSGTSGTPSTPRASGAFISGDDGPGEAMECVGGPSRSVPGRQETPEGVPMQGGRVKEPLDVERVSSSGETPPAAGPAAFSEGSAAGGTSATSTPAATPGEN
ncbi:uncharacterized protein LY79DRAFT_323462 [Colletotrichum navitas]|uniref:Purine-cytosine permease fcy22 n=1 Tax=Colletotrichum navitas TaxID=681940 RepID=A0AAD8QBM0_9PEZI|nr:uncharacterized protein LY79DRAFT_323462 [Colletotrichum navitas]KAK1597959.1 hypothetical protein LY79DRAFT_323462 [Colletotrichum navitas]